MSWRWDRDLGTAVDDGPYLGVDEWLDRAMPDGEEGPPRPPLTAHVGVTAECSACGKHTCACPEHVGRGCGWCGSTAPRRVLL